jgi:hypothetical protein
MKVIKKHQGLILTIALTSLMSLNLTGCVPLAILRFL